MKKTILLISMIFSIAIAAYAVESNKPSDHNTNWEQQHGKKANMKGAECFVCHTEKLECITCHEDTKPRTHTATWTNKTHGMEARWSRSACSTCHTDDSCTSCHETAMPASHNSDIRSSHCNTGCQLPVGRWTNTMNKDCVVCHQKVPTPTHVKPQ